MSLLIHTLILQSPCVDNWIFVLKSWWRHQMETFSALLAICVGNSLVPGEFPTQRHGALMFTLICAQINGWVNNREAGDLRCHRAYYDVIVMWGHSVSDTLELCNMEPQAMLCWHLHGSFIWYFRKPTLLCNTIFGVAQHSWLPDIVSTLLSAYKTAHSCLHRQALLQEL